MKKSALVLFILLAPQLMAIPALVAGSEHPKVMPVFSKPQGMSYSQWGDAYLRWWLSISVDRNPMLDTTGDFAGEGQAGPAWFVGGNLGGFSERTFTIPPGRTLLLLICSAFWVNIPELGDPEWTPELEASVRAEASDWVDNTKLACEIDGLPVENIQSYRFPTLPGEAFMVDLPDNNLPGVPAGTYGPSIQDGVYLLLPPLSAGLHSIHVSAASSDGQTFDLAYHITVTK